MTKRYKCRECANFLPIEGTVYGHCKVRPFAQKQGGQLTDKEFLTTRSRNACNKNDFVKADKIPEVVRVCKRCGKEFVVEEKGRREFCCDECRVKWHQEEQKRLRAERKAQKALGVKKISSAKTGSSPKVKQPKEPTKPKMSISDICKMALEEHLSYGEIVLKYGL